MHAHWVGDFAALITILYFQFYFRFFLGGRGANDSIVTAKKSGDYQTYMDEQREKGSGTGAFVVASLHDDIKLFNGLFRWIHSIRLIFIWADLKQSGRFPLADSLLDVNLLTAMDPQFGVTCEGERALAEVWNYSFAFDRP